MFGLLKSYGSVNLLTARSTSVHQDALCLEQTGYTIDKTRDSFVNAIAVSFNSGLEPRAVASNRCYYVLTFYRSQHFFYNHHLHYDTDHDDVTCHCVQISYLQLY